jgi:hypothetical protein
MDFPFYRCVERPDTWFLWGGYQWQNDATQFSKVWDLGGWPYIPVVSWIFWVCLYNDFGDLDVSIQIWAVGTSNTLQTFWGETCRCVEASNLINLACQTCASSTFAHWAPNTVLT